MLSVLSLWYDSTGDWTPVSEPLTNTLLIWPMKKKIFFLSNANYSGNGGSFYIELKYESDSLHVKCKIIVFFFSVSLMV